MSRPKASRPQKSGHFLRDHAKWWSGKRQTHEKMPNKRRFSRSRLAAQDRIVNNLLKTSGLDPYLKVDRIADDPKLIRVRDELLTVDALVEFVRGALVKAAG